MTTVTTTVTTTGGHPCPDAAALRARAAERGVSVAEYVREERRRTEREAAWERALADLASDGERSNA